MNENKEHLGESKSLRDSLHYDLLISFPHLIKPLGIRLLVSSLCFNLHDKLIRWLSAEETRLRACLSKNHHLLQLP